MRQLFLIFLFPMFLFSQSNFEKGERLFAENKLSEAKGVFKNESQNSANYYKSIEYLGDIEGKNKNWDDAISYYKILKTKFPKNANYWYKYGGALGMKAKNSNKFKKHDDKKLFASIIPDKFQAYSFFDKKYQFWHFDLFVLW